MIGSSTINTSIASVYAANTRALADALTRIASGKKFQNASEDLIGFIRSQDLQVDISGYEKVRENLTTFKSYTSAALTAGSTIYEKLVEMKELAVQYADTEDADLKAEYAAEFNTLKTLVVSTIDNTFVDGDQVTKDTDEITAVDFDPNGDGSLSMTFTDIADSTVIDAFDITAEVDPTDEDDVQAEIDSALVYLSEAKSFDAIADQQLNLTGTIINSKKAVMSLITDIDDAEEMSKVLDLSLRQQASMAMMAQGNIIQSSLLKLYE